MSDLISRQTAFDKICEVYEYEFPTASGAFDEFATVIIPNLLINLPSAQPERCEDCRNFNKARLLIPQPERPRWIPVSERLPKIDMSYPHHEDYLVQYDSGDMDVASWSNVNRFWADHVTEPYWNCVQFAKVIAWMPLPEPYKEEQE